MARFPTTMSDPFDDLFGDSPALHTLKQRARRVAATNLPTLLRGETGTGKEVLARCLHRASHRVGLFVPVDCAAMVGGIVQSELFGHTKGAFTGASRPREGLVHAAQRGTLFLDEIAELSPEMQSRLLRLLENGTYRPVGADTERVAD
ncbi:MAG: transcriptional regulator with PAS, ATPase and Fis domain, partial [Kiritimatiellia bacterium]